MTSVRVTAPPDKPDQTNNATLYFRKTATYIR